MVAKCSSNTCTKQVDSEDKKSFHVITLSDGEIDLKEFLVLCPECTAIFASIKPDMAEITSNYQLVLP